jgi:hypothetical protein
VYYSINIGIESIYTHDYIRMEITVLYLKISRHQLSINTIFKNYSNKTTYLLWVKSSLQKFYGRHHGLMDRYEIFIFEFKVSHRSVTKVFYCEEDIFGVIKEHNYYLDNKYACHVQRFQIVIHCIVFIFVEVCVFCS